MALQLGALRDALEDAGARPDKAILAAQEVATYETRLGGIEGRLGTLTWMVGLAITLVAITIGGEFTIWSRLVEQERHLGNISAELVGHSAILVSHTGKLNDLTAKLAEQSAKLSDLAAKVAEQSAKLTDQSTKLDAILAKLH